MSFVDTLKTFCFVILGWIKTHGTLLGILSVASWVGSILFCTLAIIYLPLDYFSLHKREYHIQHPILRGFLFCFKNLLALVLILIGIAMLPLPGQGLLTILIGIVISDLPGRRKLQRRLIGLPAVLPSMNRVRIRFRRPPIVLDE